MKIFVVQMDVYSYLLKAMGYDTTNKAYLAFYYPDECNLHNGMPFHCKIIEVITNHREVKMLLDNAYRILNDQIPESGENCNYCKWINDTNNELLNLENSLMEVKR